MKWDWFHCALLVYIIVYSIVFSFIFIAHAVMVPADEKDDEPWETPLDILLIVIGLIGMVLLLVNFQNAAIKEIWRPTSIALLGIQLFLKWRGEKWLSKNVKPEELKAAYILSAATGLILLPSLVFNIYYAFFQRF